VSERRLRIVIGALALVGLGIASYLTVVHYAGGQVVCATGGCETVQQSRYATIGGVPVALLGVLAYLALLATAFTPGIVSAFAGASVALGGIGFGLYLLGVQLWSLDAICAWCVASDAVMSVLAAAAVARLLRVPRPAPEPAVRYPKARPTPKASAAGSRRGTRTSSRSPQGSPAQRGRKGRG
jgi:uncharacterized membrane protein